MRDGEHDWMVVEKGHLFEILHRRARPGRVYRRRGEDACLCATCVSQRLGARFAGDVPEGTWLWQYQRQERRRCDRCGRSISMAEGHKRARQQRRRSRPIIRKRELEERRASRERNIVRTEYIIE